MFGWPLETRFRTAISLRTWKRIWAVNNQTRAPKYNVQRKVETRTPNINFDQHLGTQIATNPTMPINMEQKFATSLVFVVDRYRYSFARDKPNL